jgi:hypothetical protein
MEIEEEEPLQLNWLLVSTGCWSTTGLREWGGRGVCKLSEEPLWCLQNNGVSVIRVRYS